MKGILDRPRLLLMVTAFSWAANVVIGRAIAGYVPPVMLACLRWSLATLILFPIAWPHFRNEWSNIVKHRRVLLFLGFLGPASYNSLFYLGLVSTEALNGLILNAAGPMFIALAGWSIFGDRLGVPLLTGMATGFAGVLIIIAKGDITSLASLRFNPGDLILLAAIAAWSSYTAFLRKRPPISWQSFSLTTYAIAAAVNVPLAIIENSLGHAMIVNWLTISAIIFVAIVPSVIGYVFYNRAVELLGPAPAGLYLFLIPVFGALLATGFLGEKLHWFHAVGFAAIIAGVLIGSRRAAPVEA